MSRVRAKTDWLALAGPILILAGLVAAVFYMSTGDVEGLHTWPGMDIGWLRPLAMCLPISASLIALSLGGRIHWHGQMPVAMDDGYGWRQSVRARLIFATNLCWLAMLPNIPAVLQQYWFRQDWGRFTVAGLFALVIGYFVIGLIKTIVGGKIILAVTSEGITSAGLRGGFLGWDQVEWIAVNRSPESRQVTLMTLDRAGGPGPAVVLNLDLAGVSSRDFVSRVEDVAPQVRVQGATARYIDFSAA